MKPLKSVKKHTLNTQKSYDFSRNFISCKGYL